MRRDGILGLFLSAALLAGSASGAWSKGLFITPGTRANSMGGAYSAIADDATAIFWNPAGLTRIAGKSAQVSAFYVAAPVTGNRSLKSLAAPQKGNMALGEFPFPAIFPTEPSYYDSKDFNTAAIIPFMGGTVNTGDIAIGFGYYGSGGGGGTFEDKIPAGAANDIINAKLSGMFGFSVANVSAAKELVPGLSFGLGVDYIGYFESQEARKAYTVNGSANFPYLLRLTQEGVGNGVQVNGGLIYQALPNLRAGLVYRSGATISITGKAVYLNSGLALAGIPDVRFESDYDKKYHYPTTYGISAAYDPVEKMTIAVNIDQTRYSPTKNDITFEHPVPSFFDNDHSDARLKDVTQFRIGTEYRYSDKLAFRAGIQNDPVDIPTDHPTLLSTDQFDSIYYSIGAGYRLGSVALDLTVTRDSSNKPTSTDGREYGFDHFTYRLAANYTF